MASIVGAEARFRVVRDAVAFVAGRDADALPDFIFGALVADTFDFAAFGIGFATLDADVQFGRSLAVPDPCFAICCGPGRRPDTDGHETVIDAKQ